MKRSITNTLVKWLQSKTRKPLLLRGARQTGKTWVLKEFGKLYFENTIYINFEELPQFQSLFLQDFDITRIIEVLEVWYGKKIKPENSLIIFDEIQIAEKGITSLKYFCENAPEYHIIAAGSLLGLFLHSKSSFPVGKVDILDMYPMSFEEVLRAQGEDLMADQLVNENWEVIKVFHDKLMNLVKQYMFVGGMPEAVKSFIEHKDFELVRNIQKQIIMAYESDFSKHAPKEQFPRIQMVWNSIPAQLGKENKKFVFNILREGARAKDFELAIQWLQDCGLVSKVNRIKEALLPLKVYEESSVFKLYLVDIGLLGALSFADAQSILSDRIINDFKGAMAEQFIYQSLRNSKNTYISYWTNDRSTSEVDFVIQKENKIIAMEVKSGTNVKSKSLRFFYDAYQPDEALRYSALPYKKQDWVINMPLYHIFK